MESENEPLEEEIPMKKTSFLGSMLVFQGVVIVFRTPGTSTLYSQLRPIRLNAKGGRFAPGRHAV